MSDLERIARNTVFGSNLSNADAVRLWEACTGLRVRQAKRCGKCGGYPRHPVFGECPLCGGTGYVDGFTPRDAEREVEAIVAAINGKEVTHANDGIEFRGQIILA